MPMPGFGGWVLVTPDANWQAKWETPSNTVPSFSRASEVKTGGKLFILIFFTNPKLDSSGQANVACDITLTRPDGSISTHQPNAVCFRGVLKGDPHDTYLSGPVIGFGADPGDLAGQWKVDVVLKDNNRHQSLPLKSSFLLRK